MNEVKCWLTRRYNGQYLATAFKPILHCVAGTYHNDAYIRYGDPIGYINIPYEFGVRTFDNPPEKKVEPQRAILQGDMHDIATHILVYDDKVGLYTIYKTHDCYIANLCQWFVQKLFGITELLQPQPVYFTGKMVEKA